MAGRPMSLQYDHDNGIYEQITDILRVSSRRCQIRTLSDTKESPSDQAAMLWYEI